MTIMSVAGVDHILKQSRTAIIELLKSNGEMSVDDLAGAIGVTKVCIRRHLRLLESDGLLSHVERRHERGRPRHIYRLTDKAHGLFPQRYDNLARAVLSQVEKQYGSDGLHKIIQGGGNELIESFSGELKGLNFEDRVKRLSALIDDRGYVTEVERLEDGSFRLSKNHCPMEKVAAAFPIICEQELRIYTESTGGEIVRECRIVDGNSVCEFQIREKRPQS